MTSKASIMRFCILFSLFIGMCWLFLSRSPVPSGINIQRQLGFAGHVLVFSLFSLTCSFLFPKAKVRTLLALLGCAMCLEGAQLLIPGRGADIMDFAMNCLGISIGFTLFHIGAALTTSRRQNIR